MRSLLIVYLLYVTVQAWTSIDPALRASWLVYLLLGGFAWSDRHTLRSAALEVGLWLRILAVPVLFFYWGSTLDVLGPGLACTLFAFSLWRMAGRRWWTFLMPLTIPVGAILFVKFVVLPHVFPRSLLASRISGAIDLAPQPLPGGWARYHCQGYSIGVPRGMLSGMVGGERANMFAFRSGRPPNEPLSSMAVVFPRPTAFEYDQAVAPMAAQVLGAACEFDYARHILNAGDGHLFLVEKLSWLGLQPPERVEEMQIRGARGFLISEPRVNWYRARIYFENAGRDCQSDIWLYGDGAKLTRERALQQLATLRVGPDERELPTIEDCRSLAMGPSAAQANVLLSTLLTMDSRNFEALYLQSINQRWLGWAEKANSSMDRLEHFCNSGQLDRVTIAVWARRYAVKP